LTTRLRELENRGVITRTVMHTSPPTVEYALTELGKQLGPILKAIAEVGKELTLAEGEDFQKDQSLEKAEALSA
jgi:DNA-binding HxlR family transcriptional regulator